jgi:DNA-binding transcriptional ArsR family regulator
MSLDDERIGELRATAHPLRLQMLSLLTGASLSAAEVARELGITQANASYHLRLLHSAGLLELAGEEAVRGGRAKKYRHRWDATAERSPAGEADRAAVVRTIAAAIPARFTEREPDSAGVFTDADLWVPPETWRRAVELVTEASRLLHAGAQPPRTEGTIRAHLSVAAFRLRGDGLGPR